MKTLTIVLFCLLDSLAAALYTTVHRWRYVKALDRAQAWTFKKRWEVSRDPARH